MHAKHTSVTYHMLVRAEANILVKSSAVRAYMAIALIETEEGMWGQATTNRNANHKTALSPENDLASLPYQ